jgi:hypothetical protein
MAKRLLTIVLVLAIFFVVAFLVYALAATVTSLKPPSRTSPLVFLSGVLVVKTGHAIAFVVLFDLARGAFARHWLLYAFVWWLMFAVGEIGQAVGFDYSWLDALTGVIAEAIYFPAAGFVTSRLIGTK